MESTLVPIALFGAIVGAIWLFSHFNFKKRLTAHDTLKHAIDNGQQVSPDLIEKMSLLTDPVRADLRRGVLFIAFGFAFLFLAWMIGLEDQEPIRPMIGVASFPILLGIAYLGLWRFGHDRTS